jgi:L-rhamnose mutarotase
VEKSHARRETVKRVGFQMKVIKDKIEEYKEVHRNVWPEVCQALKRHGWHRYSLFMNQEGVVFGYFETSTDFQMALEGFMKEEATRRWGEANGGLIERSEGEDGKFIVELEEVFHLD